MSVETSSDYDDQSAPANGPIVARHNTSSLSAAAQRALAEAGARMRAAELSAIRAEVGGRGGLDPVRFGDWEVKGLTTDF